jgi:arsenite methyltransferase
MTAPEHTVDVKACCAAAYDQDAVALILGQSYHPGGLALTRHLAAAAGLQPGQRVLDVASGPGATALLLATDFDVTVDGVDLGQNTLRKATAAAQAAGLADRVRFHLGDAERLPFPDDSFDAVLCECAFCTFPDKATAAREFRRVLRPGGRVGLTDITVAAGGLPRELDSLAGWIACLADAKPAAEYARILAEAGLQATVTENHDTALAGMVEQIDARLRALRMRRSPAPAGVDLDRALDLTAQAAHAVASGVAGYALLLAEKPR